MLLASALLVVYFTISYMIASGVTKAERRPQDDDPAAHGLNYEEVTFPSRKGGVVLDGWYLPGGSGQPAVIFVHGIGNIRSGDNAVEIAERLVSLGYHILLFDLRAHGTSESDRMSGGYFEQQDVLGALDFLVERGVPPGRFALVGFSMGAGISLLTAAGEPAIQAVVADSPFANVSELIAQETGRKTSFPEWVVPVFLPASKLIARLLYGIDIDSLAPERAAAQLSYPIMVVHGEADTRIPPEHGRRVYQAAQPGSTFWLVPGVEHVDAFLTYPDEYVERVTRYLSERFDSP